MEIDCDKRKPLTLARQTVSKVMQNDTDILTETGLDVKKGNKMENIVAMWRPGVDHMFKKADPQKVASEIFANGLHPTNEQIVEIARNKNAESHKLFDWDDQSCARKYRLVQAHNIMTALVVNIVGINKTQEETEMKPLTVRYAYSIDNGKPGYTPIHEIMANPNDYNALLNKAKSELNAFKAKYAMLKELKAVFNEIDKL